MARLLSCVILLAFAATTSGAAFQNGKFDQGSVPNTCNVFDLPVGSNVITGWTVSVGTIDWESPPPCGWLARNGHHSIDLVGQACVGGIQQTFDTTGKSQFNMGWVIKTIDFVASGSTSTVNFVSDVSASGPPCNGGAVIAKVKVRQTS